MGVDRRSRRRLAFALAASLTASCEAGAPARSHVEPTRPSVVQPEPEPALGSAPSSASAAPVELEPEPELDTLPVHDFAPAVVSIAERGAAAHPIVLATHGNFDRPEWQCEVWRGIVGPKTFVLCPRGIERPDSPTKSDRRFTYASNAELEEEITAAQASFASRFGDRAAGPTVYTGFSLGAIMGVAILARSKPGLYDRAVFVEGGYDRVTAKNARAMAAAGVRRVLFACGQPACFQGSKAAAKQLDAANIESKVVGVATAGHAYDGPVAETIRQAWEWVVAPLPVP